MPMRYTVLFVIAALGGCATVGNTAVALRQFQGGSVQSLIARLGYPDKQEAVLDKTAYYWNTQGVNDPDAATCQIKAVAGADKIVVDTSLYGNIYGCEPVLKRLR